MQKLSSRKPAWTTEPTKEHQAIFLVNVGFTLLHFLQTQLWYDGLAQDAPIWTSQGSVIVMLVLIIMMENPRRGYVWGKKLPIGKDAMKGVYKWHGYYIQWALVYTFWFHPMDSAIALLFGFIYMSLLLIQSGSFLLKIHLDQRYITFLEVFVWIHGTTVAIESDYIRKASESGISWPIFFFGFLGMLVFTQQFGLTKKRWIHFTVLGIYVALIIAVYSIIGWRSVWQVVSIPMALLLGALGAWGAFALVPRLKKKKALPVEA